MAVVYLKPKTIFIFSVLNRVRRDLFLEMLEIPSCFAKIERLRDLFGRVNDPWCGTFESLLENEHIWVTSALYEVSRLLWNERVHVTMVRAVTYLCGEPSEHDWSKNLWFFFVTTLKFHYGIVSNKLDVEVERLVNNHYDLEPHHPKHFGKCPQMEIPIPIMVETASDIGCRHYQFARNGEGLDAAMKQYEPRYVKKGSKSNEANWGRCVEVVRIVLSVVGPGYLKIFHDIPKPTV